MGSNRRLNIAATGFPGTNETWRFIQEAWRVPLDALARLCGQRTILFGCNVTSTNQLMPGVVVYNGTIYPVVGGELNSGQHISLHRDTVEVPYDVDIDQDGQQDVLPGYETTYFVAGTGGNMSTNTTLPLDTFIRLKTIKDLSAAEVFTEAMKNKLAGIETNAQKNVQSDWNVSNQQSDAYIKNKPTIINPLRVGSSLLGDFPTTTDQKRTITFPSVGTDNYVVAGSLVAVNSANWSDNNDVIWSIGAKTATSFEIYGREVHSATQNLRFDYVLFPLNTNPFFAPHPDFNPIDVLPFQPITP